MSHYHDSDRNYLITQFIDEGNQFDIDVRFIRIMRSVFAKIPLDALADLVDRHVIFFAQEPSCLARVLYARAEVDIGTPVVYLSPGLLSLTDETAASTFAHEMAHVYLGHTEDFSEDAHAVGR